MFLYKHFLPKQAGTELDDVVRNIGFILRTKEGCGSFLRGFGAGDTGYRTPEEMLVTVAREVRQGISEYEPRVEIVEIEEIYGDDGRVSLAVHCRLRSTRQPLDIALHPGRPQIEVIPLAKSG